MGSSGKVCFSKVNVFILYCIAEDMLHLLFEQNLFSIFLVQLTAKHRQRMNVEEVIAHTLQRPCSILT